MAYGGKRANSGRKKIKISDKDLEELSDNTYKNFLDGIRSEITSSRYTRILNYELMEVFDDFFKGSLPQRCDQLVALAKKDNPKTAQIMKSLARKLKARTESDPKDENYLNPSSVGNYFKPIKKLFEMNDVPFNWKPIHSIFPDVPRVSFTKNRGYSKEEIRKMLEFAKGTFDRSLVLMLSSSGMRVGALCELTWKDVKPVYEIDGKFREVDEVLESEMPKAKLVCGIVVIYKGSSSEGFAFITPEAYESLISWKSEYKKLVMHTPKEEDPIFINYQKPHEKKFSKVWSVSRRIDNLLEKAGIATKLPKGVRRRTTPKTNGFRYYFNNIIKNTHSEDSNLAQLIKTEFMMNHTGIAKHDRNYFKANVMELVKEYVKSVLQLTISKEIESQQELISKQKKIEELELVKDEVMKDYEERISRLERLIRKDTMKKQEE